MKIDKYFRENYIELVPATSEIDLIIEEFMPPDDKTKYASPAESVYLHRNRHELFVILNCTDLDADSLEEVCSVWQNNVLCFTNFCSNFQQEKKFLKYNVTLLFLYNSEQPDISDIIFQTEKSLSVCKKIFIRCDATGELYDEGLSLPFFFEPLINAENDKDTRSEQRLQELLPTSEDLNFIFLAPPSTTEEKNLFDRWINEHANL